MAIYIEPSLVLTMVHALCIDHFFYHIATSVCRVLGWSLSVCSLQCHSSIIWYTVMIGAFKTCFGTYFGLFFSRYWDPLFSFFFIVTMMDYSRKLEDRWVAIAWFFFWKSGRRKWNLFLFWNCFIIILLTFRES